MTEKEISYENYVRWEIVSNFKCFKRISYLSLNFRHITKCYKTILFESDMFLYPLRCLLIILFGVFFLTISSFRTLRKSRPHLKNFLVAQWFDSTATINVPLPKTRVYNLFSQFNEHPTWSPWLDSVEYEKSRSVICL